MRPAMPDRADCVDDVSCWEPVPLGYLGFAGFAAVEGTTLCQEVRSSGTMNRAVNTTTAKEGLVGSIDDCVDALFL